MGSEGATPSAEALVLVVDTGASLASLGPAVFSTIRFVARGIALRRLLGHGARDAIGLIAVGSDTTHHAIDRSDGPYHGVHVVHPIAPASPAILGAIDGLTLTQSGATNDLVDCLAASVPDLVHFVGSRKMRKRIVILSDAATELNDPDHLPPIADALLDHAIQVDVILTHPPAPFPTSPSPPSPSSPEADTLDSYLVSSSSLDNEVQAHLAQGAPSQNHAANGARMSRLATLTNGVVLGLDEARDDVARPVVRASVPRCKFRGTLDVGTTMKIPVELWAKTQKTEPPASKRVSWEETRKAWDSPANVDMDNSVVRRAKPKAPQQDRNSVVPLVTPVTRFSAVSKEELEDPSLMVSGHRYGADIVAVSELNGAILEYEPSRKELDVIGFVAIAEVPFHSLMGPVSVVVPMQGCSAAWNMFLPLVLAMLHAGKCMIASHVEKSRSELRAYSNPRGPALVHLWPHRHQLEGGESQYRLYMAELPTNESVRSVGRLPPIRVDLRAEQQAATDAFVDSLMLGKGEFKTSECFNPAAVHLNANLVKRAETGGREGILLDPSADVAILVNPIPSLESKAGRQLQHMRKIFPLVRKPKFRPSRARENHQARLTGLSSFLTDSARRRESDHGGGEERKKDDEEYLFLEDDEDDPELLIRDGQPAADFERLIAENRRYREFAFHKLPEKVSMLIRASWNGDNHRPSLDAIKSLRKGSIEHSRAEEHNSLLIALVDAAQGVGHNAAYKDQFAAFVRDQENGLSGKDSSISKLISADELANPSIRGVADEASQRKLDHRLGELRGNYASL